MASSRPGWVIADLMDVIGLDKETVETMIAPDLDNYTSEPRLRSHLQDFLGPSPKAKAFTDRYLSFRFPSIASSSQFNPPSNLGPHPEKSKKTSQPPSRSSQPPQPRPQAQALNVDELHARFGQGGKIYQKNKDADDASWANPIGRSGGSGSNTPGRPAGAVTFNEARPASKRIEHTTNGSGSGKGKGVDKIWDMPRSKEVKRLEGIIGDLKGLQNSEGKVRKDDESQNCFCQARNHPISHYTPHCPHCGLILCALQRPHHPCPSCLRTLQTPAQLARLINQVQSEVETQLEKEQMQQEVEERSRIERIAQESGGGSFPILHGSSHLPSSTPNVADAGRKVLTIGGKGKGKGKSHATLTTTYSKPTPISSRAPTPPPTDIIPRPRSPPLDNTRGDKDLQKTMSWRDVEDRPWGDMKLVKRGGWNYVERAVLELVEEDKIGRRRRKGRENADKGLGVDGKKVVGAA